ncbi:erythromycin esterase family protein [Promicromonospora sp. NPDC060204]|uniref:erythromycin esterase family protein n=1 Tax=Promicromonospora sp. NPDC060204 TaxID=3347071 RepID=UPI00364CE991
MSDDLTAWLGANARRLATLDPDADDDADLLPLLEIVGDARVVAIGESMHRIHEMYLVRHRILRFLARHGFTAYVMESGFPEARLVDDWVSGRSTRPVREVLERGVTYSMGRCQEMLDLLAWLRTDGGVRFYGADVPDSAASARPAVEAMEAFLADVDPGYAAHVLADLLPLFDYLPADRSGIAQAAPALHAYIALPAAERAALTALVGELAERVRARRIDYLEAGADPRAVAFAEHAARVARQTDAFLAAMPAGATRAYPPGNVRDVTMADTVEWVLEREPRVVVAAANGHVQRTPFHAPPFVPQPMTTMGRELADRLGDDLVVLGTTFGGGTAWLHRPGPDDAPGHSTPFTQDLGAPDPTSLDAALAAPGLGSYYVDLRPADGAAAAALDATRGTHNGTELQLVDARRAFDAVVHVDRVTPWHTWIPMPERR